MSVDGDSVTSLTLLGRLRARPTDESAWSEFVARYGGRIDRWCHEWGLQDADAQDVAQNVLTDLARQMRDFEYRPGGRFRSWLRTVAKRAWCDYQTRLARPGTGSGDSAVWELLNSVPAHDDLIARLEQECDRELLEEATRRVKARVQAHTWEAFRLTALEELSGAEAAARLGIKVGTVFVARAKVDRMLREELQELQGEES